MKLNLGTIAFLALFVVVLVMGSDKFGLIHMRHVSAGAAAAAPEPK